MTVSVFHCAIKALNSLPGPLQMWPGLISSPTRANKRAERLRLYSTPIMQEIRSVFLCIFALTKEKTK